jgi:hypothetical protein
MYNQFTLTTLHTNDIAVRAAMEGQGPLVIMVHGWPELWYSWRHQIKPIAAAGYRVLAPDVRGHGGSDKPYPVEAYDMATMMADVIGLMDAVGEDRAILIGHDWGAPICWNTACGLSSLAWTSTLIQGSIAPICASHQSLTASGTGCSRRLQHRSTRRCCASSKDWRKRLAWRLHTVATSDDQDGCAPTAQAAVAIVFHD